MPEGTLKTLVKCWWLDVRLGSECWETDQRRERERERDTMTVWRSKYLLTKHCLSPLSASVYHSLVLLSSAAVEQVDHKIFRIPQKCNNTANIFVWEYIVDDALTIGCAAEIKFMNITLYYIVLNSPHIRDDVLYLSSRSWCRKWRMMTCPGVLARTPH